MLAPSVKSQSFWAYLQMMRPANILTAWADILVGFAASGTVVALSAQPEFTPSSLLPLVWLLLSTTGLYGGGVVFNDIFDAELDAQERPERPLPSGRASMSGAIALGVTLLVLGVVAAAQVSLLSAALAAGIATAALLYDAASKHSALLGPVNMGLCRGMNWLLGVSVVPLMVQTHWFLALIPLVYIAAITAISQGEVHGGSQTTGVIALLLLNSVIGGVLGLGLLENYHLLGAIPFVVGFGALVVPSFVQATLEPQPDPIRKAVRTGILCLIVLDAAIASGFANPLYGLLVLSLLPVSKQLAKLFAVT